MLSPVCTPIGSTFSIEQMTTKLSARSRMTSSSNSFQPITDSSSSTSWTGLRSRPRPRDLAELLDVVGDAAADAAERERRADDDGKPSSSTAAERLLDRAHVAALGHVGADLAHRVAEQQAVLGDLDRLDRRADQLDAVLREHAVLAERDREVERGLAADGRQHRVGPLALDDRCEDFRRQRLDVGPVGDLRVGHDRRRVAVDEDDLEPLGAQRLARLRARVVELARLPDDDRAGADDEDALDIGAFGHDRQVTLAASTTLTLAFHLVEELPEQVVRVVRARARLRDGTARRRPAWSRGAALRPCRRRG